MVLVEEDRWVREVNFLMKEQYAVTLDDVGLSTEEVRRLAHRQPDPAKFVSWFAEKYDLLNYDEISLGRGTVA